MELRAEVGNYSLRWRTVIHLAAVLVGKGLGGGDAYMLDLEGSSSSFIHVYIHSIIRSKILLFAHHAAILNLFCAFKFALT